MVARTPRRRMYRTMQGRMVDIEKLRAQNENERAVGNMNVNARGDVLGPGGSVVAPKSDVIQKYYEQPRGRVDDTPTRSKPTPVRREAPEARPTIQQMTPVAEKPKPAPKAQPKKVTVSQPAPQPAPKQTEEKKGIDAALDGLE